MNSICNDANCSMPTFRGFACWGLITTLTPLPFTAPVWAQAVDSPIGALEEVVVTARKREESLQDAPISIQAFSHAGLQMRNITDISQIGDFTPNMVFDRAAAIGGSNSSAIVYIRGIGQDAAIPTIDLGVGTYLDGVYIARSVGGVFDLVDAERIEVLRGPQGTLFGRNTIGGAINVVTRKPTEDFYTELAVELGSDNLVESQVTVNGALFDNVYSKFSLLSTQRDGYVERPDGTDLGDQDQLAGRLAFRWDATDDLSVDISADATTSDTNGAPWTLIDVQRNAPFPQFHNAFLVPPSEGCFVPPPMGSGSTSSTNPMCYNEQWSVDEDADKAYGGLAPEDTLDVFGVAGTVTWNLGDRSTIKSITAYRDASSDFSIDQDHSPHLIAHVVSDTEQDQFSQEFQFLGSNADASINYIVGLYYFQESSDFLETVSFSPVSFRSGGAVDNDSSAIFGQLTYDFSEKWSLTAGLRYTDDTKRFTPDQIVLSNNNDRVPPPLQGTAPGQVPPMPPPGTRVLPEREEELSIEEINPELSLSYRWNDAVMTYLSYSEGFKSGGFTQRVFPPQEEIPSFGPEFAEVYELGFKIQTRNNRVRLNGAVFHTDYEDLQIVSQAETVAPVVLNAGAAEIQGFELDLQAVPFSNLRLETSVGYLDGDYTALGPGTGLSINNALVKAPQWSAVVAATYTIRLAAGGSLTPRVDYSYTDDKYNNAINSGHLHQDGYGLINLGLTYESTDGAWRILAYGKNLSDERFISAGYSEANGSTLNLGISEVVRDRGREWGLKATYRFE